MCRRRLARIVAIGLLGVGGSGLGCSDSSSSPSLMPTVMPSPVFGPVPAGFNVRSLSPTGGPTIGGDYIRVFGYGFRSGATITIDGGAVPVTRVTENFIDARTVAHAIAIVDVVITNGDGQAVTLMAGYSFGAFSLSGGPGLVAPGEELTVSWVTPAGRGCSGGGDWIALYRIDDPDNTGASNGDSDIWYDHVCGVVSGTWKLKAPAVPGQYEFRFMVGDFSVARSDTIVVRE